MKPNPGISFLLSEDLSDESHHFSSFLALLFPFETLAPSTFEFLSSLQVLKLQKENLKEMCSSRFITPENFRKYKRNQSEDLNEPKTYSNYLCSLRRIKSDLLLNLAVRFWAHRSVYFSPSTFAFQVAPP